jgi:hypothetical protein
VRKTLVRQGMTLAHGTFRVHETEYVCAATCRHASGMLVSGRSSKLRTALLPNSSVGYDVLVFVGLQRYNQHRQREEIRSSLARDHGIVISAGEVSRLARLFLDYLERLHHQRRGEIRNALARDGGWPLHIDATGEDGRGTLLVLYAGWRKWVLGSFKIPTENAAAIRPSIESVVAWAGLPVAIVRDLGRAMILACKEIVGQLDGPPPVLSCHYHFLADVGKGLLEPDHGKLRALFRRFKTRPHLRDLVRDLGRQLGTEVGQVRLQVLEWLQSTGTAHELPTGSKGLGVVRALAQWTLDYSIESSGQDFPFALPYLDLHDRCLEARRLLGRLVPTDPADPEVLRARDRLMRILDKVGGEVPFKAAARRLRQRQNLFDELLLRLRLRWAPPPIQGRRRDTEGAARRPGPDDWRQLVHGGLATHSLLSPGFAPLGSSSSPRSAETFPWTSITLRAFASSASARSARRRSFSFSATSGSAFFLPRRRPSRASAPSSRCLRQSVRCEEYSPSRRSRAPISPLFMQASASSRIRSLYCAVNRRRLGRSTSSGSCAPPRAERPAAELRSPMARFAPRPPVPFLCAFNISYSHPALVQYFPRR